MDPFSKFGNKSPVGAGKYQRLWAFPQGSRYVRYFQSRRSLLAWKIHGRRLDGFRNEDFAYEKVPGDRDSLVYQGKPFPLTFPNQRLINLAYLGEQMPPPAALAGTYVGPDGQKIKVPPLSDEDRRTIVRWIDLGCPIDLDYDPAQPAARGHGWLQDDHRPTLTLASPQGGSNGPLTRVLVGMHDYDSGLDMDTFTVTADFALGGAAPGQNLAAKFRPRAQGVWEWVLERPVTELARGTLSVSVKDRQGNTSSVERTFSVKR
jgi:hypothetical protein